MKHYIALAIAVNDFVADPSLINRNKLVSAAVALGEVNMKPIKRMAYGSLDDTTSVFVEFVDGNYTYRFEGAMNTKEVVRAALEQRGQKLTKLACDYVDDMRRVASILEQME